MEVYFWFAYRLYCSDNFSEFYVIDFDLNKLIQILISQIRDIHRTVPRGLQAYAADV